MEAYLDQYRHKDIRDIHALVKEFHHLCYDAKHALRYIITERNLQEEFSDEELNNIDALIEKDEQSKNQLEYLSWLGLAFNGNNSEKELTRSRGVWYSNFWGIIIGILMVLIFIVLTITLIDIMANDEPSVLFILVAIGTSVLAVRGALLAYNAIVRAFNYRKLRVCKTSTQVTVHYRPEFKLLEENLDLSAKFSVKEEEHGYTFVIADANKEIPLLHFKDIQDIHLESIKLLNKAF